MGGGQTDWGEGGVHQRDGDWLQAGSVWRREGRAGWRHDQCEPARISAQEQRVLDTRIRRGDYPDFLIQDLKAIADRTPANDARQSGDTQVGQRSVVGLAVHHRSEEHTSELQSLMRISYAVFCLKKKKQINTK